VFATSHQINGSMVCENDIFSSSLADTRSRVPCPMSEAESRAIWARKYWKIGFEERNKIAGVCVPTSRAIHGKSGSNFEKPIKCYGSFQLRRIPNISIYDDIQFIISVSVRDPLIIRFLELHLLVFTHPLWNILFFFLLRGRRGRRRC